MQTIEPRKSRYLPSPTFNKSSHNRWHSWHFPTRSDVDKLALGNVRHLLKSQ